MSEFTYTQAKVDKLERRIAELEAEVAAKPVVPVVSDVHTTPLGVDKLRARIVELEAEVASLKAHLSPEPDDKKKPEPEVLHQRQRSR